MAILIKKVFDLLVLDDADWGYRRRHEHAFFLETLFIVEHYLN